MKATALIGAGVVLLLSLIATGYYGMNGGFAAVADVLIWPNLRTLTPEENRILTPFATRMAAALWMLISASVFCLCAGLLTGWCLARVGAKR